MVAHLNYTDTSLSLVPPNYSLSIDLALNVLVYAVTVCDLV